MTFPQRDTLTVQYSTRNCTLDDRDKDAYEAGLTSLARVVETFPASALHVEIAHEQRSGAWDVKLSLSLARRHNLFARELGDFPHPAFKQCVRRLVEKVEAWKDARTPNTDRGELEVPGTFVRAPVQPDLRRLETAVADNDYVAFRDAIAIYRESLRNRIGRRIERMPDAAAQLADQFTIDDCVEAVFLSAFERFDSMRQGTTESLGEHLETMIDDSIRALAEDRGGLRRNVSFLRTARDAAHDGGGTARERENGA